MQRRQKLKDMNKRFHDAGKSYLFQVSQKEVYKEPNGEKQSGRIILNSEDSIKFWSNIWRIRKEHNEHAEWCNFFLTTIWLPHCQLWAIIGEAASLTRC